MPRGRRIPRISANLGHRIADDKARSQAFATTGMAEGLAIDWSVVKRTVSLRMLGGLRGLDWRLARILPTRVLNTRKEQEEPSRHEEDNARKHSL